MIQYDHYRFSKKEWLLEGAKSVLEILFLTMLFFRSFWGVALLFPYGIWRIRQGKEKKRRERLEVLRADFKDVILSIAFSLQAGYAMEQTISLARKDLERMDSKDRPMLQELLWMERTMALGQPVEQLFRDLAKRSGLLEIRSYAEVLWVAKKQGGNLVRISKEAADHISRSIQVQLEIDQVLAGKKLEKEIMLAMPYFILIYLQLTNGSYLLPLYESILGRAIMIFSLLFIFAAKQWAQRIIQIAV